MFKQFHNHFKKLTILLLAFVSFFTSCERDLYENAIATKKKKDFYTENISLSILKSNHPKAAATILETISITDSKAKKDDNSDLEIDTTNIVFFTKRRWF